MPQRTTPAGLTADQVYTIALRYLRRIEDLLGDGGHFGLATTVAIAAGDLSTGPWRLQDISLPMAKDLPIATAREHLKAALHLLSSILEGVAADETLFEVRYRLAPLFGAHL